MLRRLLRAVTGIIAAALALVAREHREQGRLPFFVGRGESCSARAIDCDLLGDLAGEDREP
jgi:hypothetical protein